MIRIKVQQQPFDAASEQRALIDGRADIGAVVSFTGLMRDINEGDAVRAMTLEHYPGMTEKALEEIATEAHARWNLAGLVVIHRVGTLAPTDPIVLVLSASRHRTNAFRACEFVIDYLKTKAPFWKKEITGEGERWVAAKSSDDAASQRWQS